jgi:hypothetical protein
MTATKLGRFQVSETLSSLLRRHVWDGVTKLTTVDHEPKVAVLDQEDLHAQGIVCSSFIPGAGNPDALGSCTAQASTAALSNLLDQPTFLALTSASSYADTKSAEIWAIGFYHLCTDETGDPSTEWPPVDCGSSGPYVVQEMQHLNLAAGDTIAHGPQNIVSLMQSDGLLCGSPWFNSFFEPNTIGFIDGNGTESDIQSAINSGVAGGHETYMSAIEALALTETGQVIPERTVIRSRNSWSASFGDHGSFRSHLSTWVALGNYCDFRRLIPVG